MTVILQLNVVADWSECVYRLLMLNFIFQKEKLFFSIDFGFEIIDFWMGRSVDRSTQESKSQINNENTGNARFLKSKQQQRKNI